MLAAAPSGCRRIVTPAGEAILALLAERRPQASICPSEAARRLAGPEGDWRAQMADVHAAVDELVASGAISLSWKGVLLAVHPTQKRRGPYRIARR